VRACSRRAVTPRGRSASLRVVQRPDQLSDEDLLVATAAGSPDAFGMFYERQVAVVLAVLRQRTGSAELAADLAGETFAAALLSCGRFRPGGPSATSWLLGIAQNKLRESARRHRVETRARERLGLPRLAFCDQDLERIEQLADEGQDALALLDQLPPAQRDAVRGRVVDEREYRELAEQLSCSEQLVRQNVSRGLRRLKADLKEASNDRLHH
jgi:RNA polymerase sigma factor (sigma-70 family)